MSELAAPSPNASKSLSLQRYRSPRHTINDRRSQAVAIKAHAGFVTAFMVFRGSQHVADPLVGQTADNNMARACCIADPILQFITQHRNQLSRHSRDDEIAESERDALRRDRHKPLHNRAD